MSYHLKKHLVIGPNGNLINYLVFDTVKQFHEFVDQEIQFGLSAYNQATWKSIKEATINKIDTGSAWYGTPIPHSIQELQHHTHFLGMNLLKKIRPQIQEHLAKYLTHLEQEVIPKPKIAYNDRGLGVFSFDRAAMGLFQQLKVVLGTPIEKTTTQLGIALGKERIQTQSKKVYTYFENKTVARPSLRLFLLAGANAHVSGNDLLYVGLACVELIHFMEQRGVPVELNVLVGASYHNQVAMGVVRVKRFQDKADPNQILLLSSDPRYFRYRGFQSLIALGNQFDLDVPLGLGRMEKNMGTDFIAGYEKQGFVFEQSYSLASAAMEVKRIVEDYANKINHE